MTPSQLWTSPSLAAPVRHRVDSKYSWVMPCILPTRKLSTLGSRTIGVVAHSTSSVDVSRSTGHASGMLRSGLAFTQGQREEMEDTGIIKELPDGALLVGVFDGHSGVAVANYLKDKMPEVIIPLIPELGISGPEEENASMWQKRLEDVFHNLDDDVMAHLKKSQPEATYYESGSTATVLVIKNSRALVSNVGDSRCVLGRAGNAVDLSVEHRLVGKTKEVEAEVKRVQESGAWVEDGRICGVIAVSRAFGDWEWKGEGLNYLKKAGVEWGSWSEERAEMMEFAADPVIASPDVKEIQLIDKDEFIILASDGLWDVFSSTQAVQLARTLFKKGLGAQEVADAFVEKAIQRRTDDNVVVAVVDLMGEEGWAEMSKKKLFGLF